MYKHWFVCPYVCSQSGWPETRAVGSSKVYGGDVKRFVIAQRLPASCTAREGRKGWINECSLAVALPTLERVVHDSAMLHEGGVRSWREGRSVPAGGDDGVRKGYFSVRCCRSLLLSWVLGEL